jgi:signal transduction histidine kinase/sugar lactone lactonase YvrE
MFLHHDVASQQRLFYDQFTSEKGLSENVVYKVLQDKRGFIWAATHHGLNRFDGYSFKKFYSYRDDSTSLSQSEVYNLKQDASGKFWIINSTGLNHFDPETEKAKRIIFPPQHPTSGSSDLYILNDDSVFIMRFAEILLYTQKNNKLTPIKFSGKTNSLIKFFEFADGSFGCNDSNRIFYYNRRTAIFERSEFIPGTRIKVDHAINNYFTDKNGNHFVFTLGKPIDVFDTDGNLIARLDKKDFPTIENIYSCNFSATSSGDVWIATTNGLLYYRPTVRKFTLIELVGDSRSLKGNKEIRTICIDNDENLWLGLFGEGLLKCRVKANPFSSISLDEMAREDLPRMIFGLYRWSDGEIAAETGYENFTRIKNGKLVGFSEVDKMDIETIIFLTTGKKFSELTKAQIFIVKRLFYSKHLNPSYFLLHDSNTVITHAGTLIVHKRDTSYNLKGSYSTFAMDDGAFYWSAATDGLVRVNKKDLSDTIYRNVPGNSFSLNEDYIYHVAADENNNLWIGTKGGGLNFFNRAENKFYHYTTKDGLPDNVVYFILPDKRGNLWITTNRGLSRFDVKAKTFTNYSRRDGLLNSEFNRNGGLVMDDGTFYFSGTNGIDYFNPADLEKPASKPSVFFSDIKINGNEKTLTDAQKLKHFENNITISFTANDFTRPDLIYYRYRLHGGDEWTRVQGNNSITYNSLPDGEYSFTVQSSYDNLIWSDTAAHSFVINTPWWRTTWFYLSLAIAVAGLLYAFYRYRINELKKILHLRSKISQDLHDEVGATLSSIHVYSSVASMSLEKDVTKAKDALQHINTNTRQVMENMSDIVWAINTGQIGEATLEAKLKNYGYELLTPMNIQCTYRIDKDADRKIENMEARKNILLIAKEAMNNIAKYSSASTAFIKLELDNRKLHLEISDDGIGFDYEKRRNGNGLNNMRQRAEALKGSFSCDTARTKGTTIRCDIPITNISD